MRQAIIKIGEFTATIKTGVDRFLCPENPPLESQLNQFLESIRGYSPDRFVTAVEATAKKFGGEILHLDRMEFDYENDEPGRIY